MWPGTALDFASASLTAALAGMPPSQRPSSTGSAPLSNAEARVTNPTPGEGQEGRAALDLTTLPSAARTACLAAALAGMSLR